MFEITPGEQHYNPIGVVHGGLAMTLLDSAMGCCVQTRMPAGSTYTTLEANTNLVRAISAKTGKLRAIGKVVHLGKRIATAEARLEDAIIDHLTTQYTIRVSEQPFNAQDPDEYNKWFRGFQSADAPMSDWARPLGGEEKLLEYACKVLSKNFS